MAEISERVREVLDTYAEDFEPGYLAHDVHHGYEWFPAEFEELIRAHAFTPEVYSRLSPELVNQEDWYAMDRSLRELWQDIFPDRTFPYDEPGMAPPELVDTTDENGVSRRLARVLQRYCKRRGSAPVNLTVVTRMVEAGGWSWLPRTLETQIKARVFTPDVWADLTRGGDPDVNQSTVDRDLRELWASVAPGRPYPIDAA